MKPEVIFAVILGSITFLVGVSYGVLVKLRCRAEGTRLLKNDLAFGFFVPFVLPLAAATFAKIAIHDFAVLSGGKATWIALGGFVVLLVLAITIVYGDIKMTPVEPSSLRSNKALEYETCVRRTIHESYKMIHQQGPGRERSEALRSLQKKQEEALNGYAALAPGFTSLTDQFSRGGVVAIAQFLVNCLVALIIAGFFTYLLFAVYHTRSAATPISINGAVTCLGLFSLWFPMRLYSEWYTNFYTFRSLREYWAFWVLVLIAIIGTVLLIVSLTCPRCFYHS